jgi:hypothetical protein
MMRRDAGIGDQPALQSVARADAFRNAGEQCGECRADRAIEDPDALEFSTPQQHDQAREIDAARKFRAVVLEVDHLDDTGFGHQQVLGARRGQSKERDRAFRRRRRDGANERQMPDDIADALFDLDDRGGRQV